MNFAFCGSIIPSVFQITESIVGENHGRADVLNDIDGFCIVEKNTQGMFYCEQKHFI